MVSLVRLISTSRLLKNIYEWINVFIRNLTKAIFTLDTIILSGKMNQNQVLDRLESLNYFHSISKIGVIADIQYCDEDDGKSFDGSETRRYRETLNVTKRAARSFKKYEVGAVLQLGDVIDGKSQSNFRRDFCERICPLLEIGCPESSLENAREHGTIPRLDVIGNHELYCASRKDLRELLPCYGSKKDILCYSKVIAKGKWRLVVLDSYAVSLLNGNRSELIDDPIPTGLEEAEDILKANNPNILRQPSDNYDWFKGLPTEKYRYVPYNGAIGKWQIDWLKNELKEAWDEKQFVVIFSHIPFSGKTTNPRSLHWDMEDVLNVIKENGSHVIACIGGHRHSFKYQMSDEFDTNCHYVDIPSPLVAPVGGEAHAVFEFSVKHISIADKSLSPEFEATKLHTDENLMYHSGKIYVKNERGKTMDDVGIITIHGFGEMPNLLQLARIKPVEW